MMQNGHEDVDGLNPMSCSSADSNFYQGDFGCGSIEASSRLVNGTAFDCKCLFNACKNCGNLILPDPEGEYCLLPFLGLP